MADRDLIAFDWSSDPTREMIAAGERALSGMSEKHWGRAEAVWRAMALATPKAGEAIPEGMKPWSGGDSAPDDWDGGPVHWADGITAQPLDDGDWKRPADIPLIGYTTKPATLADDAPETFWMIEQNDGKSWLSSTRGAVSADVSKCLRFDSVEAANDVRNSLPQSLWLKFKTNATEHKWLADQSGWTELREAQEFFEAGFAMALAQVGHAEVDPQSAWDCYLKSDAARRALGEGL